jgi:hypothetical protein
MAVFIPGFRPGLLLRPFFAAGELTQQSLQAEQFLPARIGDGAILDIPRSPEGDVIAVARRVARQRALLARPAETLDAAVY